MFLPHIMALALALGADRPQIVIEGGQFRPLPMAVAPLRANDAGASAAAAREIEGVLLQDFFVCGLFELLDKKSFLADPKEGLSPSAIQWSRWTNVGAEALVKGEVRVEGAKVEAVLALYTVVAAREELRSALSGSSSEARLLAHKFADEVYRFYTREDGAFRTSIAYVRKTRADKRLHVGDWDGYGARPLTGAGLSLMPSWSPDGRLLAFTSYRGGNPELWTVEVATAAVRPLVKLGRLATGASFSSDGKRVAFSMAAPSGDSYIYVADAGGANARPLTSGFGIHTSPSWSPDGKRLAFVSNSAGTPQVYLMDAAGQNVKRLTFQGNYNQTPQWSPRGDAIAFTARDERNAFDLFAVNPDTGKITRLTQDQGNNEEPSYAPNGRMIAFTSDRSGKSQMWVMSADGRNQRQMTFDRDAEVFTPAWGPKRP